MAEGTLPAGVGGFVDEETSDHRGGADEGHDPAAGLERQQGDLEIIGDRRHALDRGGLRRGFREDQGQGHTRPSPARRPFPAERGDDVWSRRKAKEYPGGYGS